MNRRSEKTGDANTAANDTFETALAGAAFDVAASLLGQGVDRELVERAMVDHVRETAFVRHMLDAGADPNCEVEVGRQTWTPLQAAADRNAPETAELLLERGAAAGVWSRGPDAMMALHHAVRNGDLELTKLLMEAGEDLYAPPTRRNLAAARFGASAGRPAFEEMLDTRDEAFVEAVVAYAKALGQRPRLASAA